MVIYLAPNKAQRGVAMKTYDKNETWWHCELDHIAIKHLHKSYSY